MNGLYLQFSVFPEHGLPYEVDLREFAKGGRKIDQPAVARGKWGGDYSGRPGFAIDLRDWYDLVNPEISNSVGAKGALRRLLRFLDRYDPRHDVLSVADLTDHHGVLLVTDPDFNSNYKRLKLLVMSIRQQRGLPLIYWPDAPRQNLAQLDDIDLGAMRKVYRALKKEAHGILAMFQEGAALSRDGIDPRVLPIQQQKSAWQERRNQAFVVNEISRVTLPKGDADLKALGCWWLAEQPVEGPSYLVPGMVKGAKGITGALRWFHPSKSEVIVLLWLFLIGTGWNLSTALGLDVSKPENWQEKHPQKDKVRVLHAFKNRADRHQFALSMARPQFHPYGIVSLLIERTRILRETLKEERGGLLDNLGDDDFATRFRIAEIDSALQSPWLFQSVADLGKIRALDADDCGPINSVLRNVVKAHAIDNEYPEAAKITTKDARSAWIGFAYNESGYHILLTRLASQHSNHASIRHYLRRKQYRVVSENSIRSLQNAVFEEISQNRILDATRLRLLTQNGSITSEQERRLFDLRQRTRLGMGCLEPTAPPVAIAPGHVQGQTCRVQRCTGCIHGVVFAESFEPLCKYYAELLEIKRSIPLVSWVGSSFEDEILSLEDTLKSFDTEEVERAVQVWRDRIRRGEVVAHDVYPSY